MRRSLLLRLLILSLTVAASAVVATALLATYDTGHRLRGEVENTTSLLETDSRIRAELLAYADGHPSWAGVEPLVRRLAEETGRRIALTTLDGEVIVDSAVLLGQGSAGLPAVPAARIDAAIPDDPPTGPQPPFPQKADEGRMIGTFVVSHGWRLSKEERRERRRLADQAIACLERQGVEASFHVGGSAEPLQHGLFVRTDDTSGSRPSIGSEEPMDRLRIEECIPDELDAPSAAARRLNREVTERTIACLERHDLAYEVSTNADGLRVVQPADGGQQTAALEQGDAARDGDGTHGPDVERGRDTSAEERRRACVHSAKVQAKRPYVAAPADLYLGTSDRFDPFSPDGRRATAVTTSAVFLAAVVVTALVGRRLVRPILDLTDAARRMEAGEHTARVPVRGDDEVAGLARAFNAMAASIENHDRQRKALMNDIAHELRTPLANVRSHLEAVEYGVLPLDDSLVRSLQEESALLERLVADLQDLAHADAGMLSIHPEERDLADLAAQAVSAHRAQAEASGVRIRLDASEPVVVHADPGRVRQALGNLVANALTHTPSGGRVDVVVREDGDEAVVMVSDTGEGIAPEHLPHVFDRFYRADPSRSRATGGSGLGLAITRHLVEAHGGTVEAASTPGEGATFTLRLPACRMWPVSSVSDPPNG